MKVVTDDSFSHHRREDPGFSYEGIADMKKHRIQFSVFDQSSDPIRGVLLEAPADMNFQPDPLAGEGGSQEPMIKP